MIRKIQSLLSRVINYCHWRTYPRFVVFESDDWGSIRSSNKIAINELAEQGYLTSKSHYINDCIETVDDLNQLAAVLRKHQDQDKNSAVFTANVVLANPDFKRIEQSDYQEYFYTPVHHEKKLFDGEALVDCWKDLYQSAVFMPQVHCREHIQWWSWMADLNEGKPDAIDSFKYSMCGVPKASSPNLVSYFEPIYIQDSFVTSNKQELVDSIVTGFKLFEEIFDFKSVTTISPVAFWSEEHEHLWSSLGVKGIQGGWLQGNRENDKDRHHIRYLGEKNRYQQTYLVRNCLFEPRRSERLCGVEQCIRSISRAFLFGKPAIISTHRFNYVSSIDEKGAMESLISLDKLLSEILNRWPDVKFVNSATLLEKLNK